MPSIPIKHLLQSRLLQCGNVQLPIRDLSLMIGILGVTRALGLCLVVGGIVGFAGLVGLAPLVFVLVFVLLVLSA